VSAAGPARLGLGVDYNHRHDLPLTLLGLCDRVRSGLSHLSIVAVPDVVAAADIRARVGTDLPYVHHLSNIAPAEPAGPDWERLRRQEEISEVLGARWCGEDLGLWSVGPYAIPYFVPPPLDLDVARLVGDRIREMATRLRRPFLAEFPSWSFVAGSAPLDEFFRTVTEVGRCGLVLDVSHVVSFALARDDDPVRVLDALPLDQVQEIHVAGGRINPRHPRRYIDSHVDGIHPLVLSALAEAVGRCPHLRGVTFEVAAGITLATVEHGWHSVESILADADFVPRLDPSPAAG
jgi:hypothetical protein